LLPLVSILGFCGCGMIPATPSASQAHAQSTFWYVLQRFGVSCDANNAAARDRFLANACVLRALLRFILRQSGRWENSASHFDAAQ
jgi:hypothetical protein